MNRFYICGTGLVRHHGFAGRIVEARTAAAAVAIAKRDWLLDTTQHYTVAECGPRAGDALGNLARDVQAAIAELFRREYPATGETTRLDKGERR